MQEASFDRRRSEVYLRRVVPLHAYAGTGLAGSSEPFIPRGCFMNNIIYIVGVIVIVIAVLSFFGFR
jgi:small-conductance mechanosensitive channel